MWKGKKQKTKKTEGTKKEKRRQKWAERPDPDGPEVKSRKQLRRRRQREVSDLWIRMHVLNRLLKRVDSSRFTTAIQLSYPVTFDAPVIICVYSICFLQAWFQRWTLTGKTSCPKKSKFDCVLYKSYMISVIQKRPETTISMKKLRGVIGKSYYAWIPSSFSLSSA